MAGSVIDTDGLLNDRISALVAQQIAALNTPQFVGAGSMTVADLLANYPASASLLGKYARVTDLWGNADEVMRCSSNGSTYFWRPQRPDFARTSTSTGGSMALTPLVTAPIVFLTGTLSSNMTITPSSTNAWPGCTFEVVANGFLGLFGVTLAGLVGVSVPLLSGNSKMLTYDGAAWRARP